MNDNNIPITVEVPKADYGLEHTVVGSVLAGVTADRCEQCGACDRVVVPVDVGDREADDMELTLLERFDFLCKNGGSVQATRDTTDEIRRAIAIAQAVEELQIAARFTEEQRKDSPIMRRADELLEGKK